MSRRIKSKTSCRNIRHLIGSEKEAGSPITGHTPKLIARDIVRRLELPTHQAYCAALESLQRMLKAGEIVVDDAVVRLAEPDEQSAILAEAKEQKLRDRRQRNLTASRRASRRNRSSLVHSHRTTLQLTDGMLA